MLTWPLFERTFNGNPNILGKTVESQGHVFRVAGVLTPHFQNLIPQTLWAGDEIRDIAATALLLDLVGIYGVIAYLVAQRTTEIGIRMALGAPRVSILQMVMSQAMRMVLIGIAIGLLCAASLTKVMSSMLYGVTPADAPTFFSVAAIITLTALLACMGPALRAALVDPLMSLRNE